MQRFDRTKLGCSRTFIYVFIIILTLRTTCIILLIIINVPITAIARLKKLNSQFVISGSIILLPKVGIALMNFGRYHFLYSRAVIIFRTTAVRPSTTAGQYHSSPCQSTVTRSGFFWSNFCDIITDLSSHQLVATLVICVPTFWLPQCCALTRS